MSVQQRIHTPTTYSYRSTAHAPKTKKYESGMFNYITHIIGTADFSFLLCDLRTLYFSPTVSYFLWPHCFRVSEVAFF